MSRTTMGDLMADYEAELIAQELANRPADEARRAATVKREIEAGLRDEFGFLLANSAEELNEDDEDDDWDDEEEDEE